MKAARNPSMRKSRSEKDVIYLDNAATSMFKAPGVLEAITEAIRRGCANPGRSAHRPALEEARRLFDARCRLAEYFDVPESSLVTFSLNATMSLNILLNGLVREGWHVAVTPFEHNSVMRPLTALQERGVCRVTILRPGPGMALFDPGHLRALVREGLDLIVATAASNVTGRILDLATMNEIRKNVPLVLDASQAAGYLPLRMHAQGVEYMACSLHKGMLGPPGLGITAITTDRLPAPWLRGGSGSASESLVHPSFMPDRLEAGTPNTTAIAAVPAVVSHLEGEEHAKALRRTKWLGCRLLEGLRRLKGVSLPGVPRDAALFTRMLPVFPLVLDGVPADEAAYALQSRAGICTRPGLQCAPLAHKTIGTFPQGTLRVSLGVHNDEEDVEILLEALEELLEERRR